MHRARIFFAPAAPGRRNREIVTNLAATAIRCARPCWVAPPADPSPSMGADVRVVSVGWPLLRPMARSWRGPIGSNRTDVSARSVVTWSKGCPHRVSCASARGALDVTPPRPHCLKRHRRQRRPLTGQVPPRSRPVSSFPSDSIFVRPMMVPAEPQPRAFIAAFSAGERAELRRQGAKAAARGECASTNPMLSDINRPGRTGESSRVWRVRLDAWQRGHASQTGNSTSCVRADLGANAPAE